jgi:alanine racemase
VNSWIEISEERLVGNCRAIAEAAGAETVVLAVVKANAYGHGAERCAVALAKTGAWWFGVANAGEGVRVRQALTEAGFTEAEILVMCGVMQEDAAMVAEHGLTPVVWTAEQVGWLSKQVEMPVHLEVDSGMGRQGCRPGAELDAVLEAMNGSGLLLDGVMTHFCAAEVAGSEKTREQRREFEAAVAQIRARGLRPYWVHAGSSSSVDVVEEGWVPHAEWLSEVAKSVGARAMVRCGISLYGYCLPVEGAGAESRLRGKLKPVMTWKTRVIDVREVQAGESIGYNATFTAKGKMRVALLPVGYSDGLRRELGGTDARAGGWAMVKGERARIVGRVSMNLTVVDVTGVDATGIEGVQVGDEVVLLGDGVTADDHARGAGTISYEILCGVRAG